MPSSDRLLSNAKSHRKAQTDAELHLWHRLRGGRFLGHKFRRQRPIGPYIVDFVCIELGVVIEADGGQHIERADDDAERTRFLESAGYVVLRFWNDEVLTRLDDVLEQVRLTMEAQALSLDPSPAGGRGKTRKSQRQNCTAESSPLPLAGEGSGERAAEENISP